VGTGEDNGGDLPLRPQGVAQGRQGPLEHPRQSGRDYPEACDPVCAHPVRGPGLPQVQKLPAFKIYVSLPPAKTPGKGNIIMLNSLKGLEDLCYSVGDLAMFVPEADLEGVDIMTKWHDNTNDTKSRVMDLDEATARLS
jgi:hypothetical protein